MQDNQTFIRKFWNADSFGPNIKKVTYKSLKKSFHFLKNKIQFAVLCDLIYCSKTLTFFSDSDLPSFISKVTIEEIYKHLGGELFSIICTHDEFYPPF